MKLRDLRRGQDCLIRAIRHLANRTAVIREEKLHWLLGPEAAADGIMTRCWEKLEAEAQHRGNPRRSKATPRKKKEGKAA